MGIGGKGDVESHSRTYLPQALSTENPGDRLKGVGQVGRSESMNVTVGMEYNVCFFLSFLYTVS